MCDIRPYDADSYAVAALPARQQHGAAAAGGDATGGGWRQQQQQHSSTGRLEAAAAGAGHSAGEASCTIAACRAGRLSPPLVLRRQSCRHPTPCHFLLCLQAAEGAPAEAQATGLAAALVQEGALRAYGKAQQVPKRPYSLEELRLNRIQPEQFLAPSDNTLGGVRNLVQWAFVAGLAGAYFSHLADLSQIVQVVLVAAFLLTVDQVGNAGGFEALLVDTGEGAGLGAVGVGCRRGCRCGL